MSYLVFARKWRPKNFGEVVGQDHVTKTLQAATRSNKIAHAYIFAGPQGVGKTSCARILAKALNCEKGPTDTPCGICSPCLEIAEGRSLDVIEIDGASTRGIDDIRTLRENVKFSPLNGRYKVYIIDEVHMLTAEAFNALLKTLEEPPPYVKFIFATTQPQKVLATILSRCQRFDFVRIPYLQISAKLKEIAVSEKIKIEDDVLFAIAKASEGSLRDAESILDQLVSFSAKDIKLSDVVSVLGVIEQEAFIKFVDSIIQHDASGALKLVGEVVSSGKDMNYFVEGLLEYYRNLMVLKIVKGASDKLMDLPADILVKVTAQASRMVLGDIMLSINHIFAAQDMARKLNSMRIPLEVLSVKLSMIGSKQQLSEIPIAPVFEKLEEKLDKKIEEQHEPVSKNLDAEVKEDFSALGNEKGFVTLEDIKLKWGELIKALSKKKMSLSTYLKEAVPVNIDGNSLTIGFPKTAVFFKEAMTHKDNFKILEEAVSAVAGTILRIKLEVVEGLTVSKPEDVVEETPFLRSALDLFNGKIIKKH